MGIQALPVASGESVTQRLEVRRSTSCFSFLAFAFAVPFFFHADSG